MPTKQPSATGQPSDRLPAWVYTLAAVYADPTCAWTGGVLAEVRRALGVDLPYRTVRDALAALAERGLLRRLGTRRMHPNRQPRLMYALTAAGRRRARAVPRELDALVAYLVAQDTPV